MKRSLALFSVYFYAAWLLVQVFCGKFGMDSFSDTRFFDAIYATAVRPYVYRALVPAIVRTIADATPAPVAAELVRAFRMPNIFPEAGITITYQYVVFCLVIWAAFVGLAYSLRTLTRHFYPDLSETVADFGVPLASMALMPIFFRNFNFVYDPATVFLFAAALASLVRQRYLLFFLLVTLAALNKETAVLLVPVFLVWARHKAWRIAPTLAFATMLTVISLGVYGYITHQFHDSPGGQMAFGMSAYNLQLAVQRPYAFLWLVGVVMAFGYFVARDWKTKPLFLRQMFLALLVPHTAMLLLVGCIDELRVFYEVFAPLVLLMAPSAISALGAAFSDRDKTQ